MSRHGRMYEDHRLFESPAESARISDSSAIWEYGSSVPRNTTAVSRMAWVPIPLFLVIIGALAFGEPATLYGSPELLISLNFVFSALTSLVVVVLVSRTFLLRGSPGLLLLGCGVLVWSAVGLLSVAMRPDDVNANVTIYNTGAALAGLCHLAGAMLSIKPRAAWPARGLVLIAAYLFVSGLLGLVAYATISHWTPLFFIQGQGGTPLRQAVLTSAASMFALAALVLRLGYRYQRSSFAHWYAIAVVLIATGLFGALLQSVFGSPLNWAARGAQYVGGIYMLVAAVIAVRDAQAWEISLSDALTQTRHRYENLFHVAVDGIAVHHLGKGELFGRFLEVNPSLCEMLGYSAEELLGPAPPVIVAPGTEAVQSCDVQPGNTTLRRELTLLRRNGAPVVVEVTTKGFREGNATLAMSIIRDISARKAAEDHVRELARRLSYHVENSPLAVIEWDADLRLTRWSGGAERLFGWRAAEVLGKRMEDFRWIHAEDEAHVAAVSGALQGGQTRSFSANRNYRKDGSVAHCEWYNSSLLDDAGNLKSILSLVLDVTGRTQAEAALRRANAELQQFAYAVSHDLQEPLRGVTVFAELLERRYGGSLDGTGVDYLKHVTTAARRISTLLSGLRAYLHVSGPRADGERTETDSAVREVLASMQQSIESAGAQVEVDPLPAVAAGSTHVQQILQNLVSNALKFRGDQPPKVHISAAPAGAMVKFAVKDNGIGIDPQYSAQVFGIFKRLHARDRYEGSGIGLAICQKIVERYGGEIWVESEPGAGSTFLFTLPAADTTPK